MAQDNLTLFKDKGSPLNHRELDDNFEAIGRQVSNMVTMPEIKLGPKMTKSVGMHSMDNTVKMIGMRPQTGDGINYTYAKDAGQLYRKAANNGIAAVDDEGNTLDFMNTDSYLTATATPDGKYIISVQRSYYIRVTNVETKQTISYNTSSWWSSTYVNYSGTVFIKDNILYIPGYYSSTYYILKVAINPDTGVLSPITRVSTSPRNQRAYYNAVGEDRIAMSNGGVNNWVFNINTNVTTTIVTPSIADGYGSIAHFPIGFGSDGKAHFIRMDWDGGAVYDIHNIYVQNDSNGLDPVAVSQSVTNELAAFGETYSYNWPNMSFQLLDLPGGKTYVCYADGYDMSPVVVYMPDTMEFATLADHNEAVFINKGE